jgi:AraC-like DNA-binding protein
MQRINQRPDVQVSGTIFKGSPVARTEVLSIEAEHPRGPVRAWEDAMSEHVGMVDPALRGQEATSCLPIGPRDFSGRLEYGALGEMSLCKLAVTPNRFSRSLTTLSPTLPTPALLVLISKGSVRLTQHGRTCVLGPGDWSLYDTLYLHEYETAGPVMEVLAFAFPRPADAPLSALFERGIAHRWDSKTRLGRVLRAMLSESFGEMHRFGPSNARKLGSALTSIAWDALREQIEAPLPEGRRAIVRARVKAHIERHLADPNLSVNSIAEACGISKRAIYRAFETDPAGSASNHIWMRRLDRCAAALRDPNQAHRPITDICFSFGFNSTSHFSRVFKERFSLAPREYRVGSMIHSARRIIELNIRHYRDLLENETDPLKRRTIAELLADEEARLARL